MDIKPLRTHKHYEAALAAIEQVMGAGVLAPNAKLRALVVPAQPQEATGESQLAANESGCAQHRPVRISWARLLERVFEIDLEHCPNCGGEIKIIAAIMEGGPGPPGPGAGDRAHPHPPGAAGPCAAAGSGARADAARSLISAQPLRSGGPAPRAEGAGCVWGFLGLDISA